MWSFIKPVGQTLLRAGVTLGVTSAVNLGHWLGADLNTQTANVQDLPLQRAKNLATFQRLLDLGADPNRRYYPNNNFRLLHYFIFKSETEKVALLLNTLAVDIDAQDNIYGDTPLHSAAQMGSAKLIKLLVENGANLSLKNKAGDNVLHKLCVLYSGLTPDLLTTIQCLIAAGVDVEAGNRLQKLPLHYFVESRPAVPEAVRASIIKLLIPKNKQMVDVAGCTPLHYATHPSDIHTMHQMGFDLNVRDQMGCTPLQRAVMRVDVKAAQALVDCGADVTICDQQGQTPLHCAAGLNKQTVNGRRLGHELVELLLKSMPRERALQFVNVKDKAGCTALHNTVLRHVLDHKVLTTLLACKADLNAQDESGKTVIHLACEMDNHREHTHHYLQHLMSQKPDLTLVDNQGKTALHHAAEPSREKITENELNERIKLIELLLRAELRFQSRSSLNREDKNQQSPAQLMAQWQQPKINALCENYGGQGVAENPEHSIAKPALRVTARR